MLSFNTGTQTWGGVCSCKIFYWYFWSQCQWLLALPILLGVPRVHVALATQGHCHSALEPRLGVDLALVRSSFDFFY